MPYLLDSTLANFRDHPILFLDFELTGLDPRCHEIIEVAALLVKQPDFSISNSYYAKVIPRHIETGDPRSLAIANYSPSTWVDAIPLHDMLKDLADLAPHAILAGWSIQNEWDFLNAAQESVGVPYFHTHRLLEVYTLAFVKLYHDQSIVHLNLSTAAKALGVYLDQHKPDSDVRATYEIFKKLSGL
jgi:DNA polymerase III epsilon subunit-like protein